MQVPAAAQTVYYRKYVGESYAPTTAPSSKSKLFAWMPPSLLALSTFSVALPPPVMALTRFTTRVSSTQSGLTTCRPKCSPSSFSPPCPPA